MSDAETAAYYDEFGPRYDRERATGYFGFINDLEFETIRPLAVGRKTLEVGCGTGLILERVQAIAAEACGVDVSPVMVGRANSKGLNVRLGSATGLPFEDRAFDVVYSFKVLPHVADLAAALAEIARVTRPDGRMVIEVYNTRSFKALNDRLRRLAQRREPVFVRHDSLGDVRRVLPPGVRILSTRGIRTFGPVALCYTLPLVGPLTRRLDRAACDGPFRVFAGYLVIELGFGEGAR